MEESTGKLSEIHDTYQRRLAGALAVHTNIDLTIPYQARVATEVMDELLSELMMFESQE